MSERKFNFVYLTTNLINGHQYIGDHSTDDLNSSKTRNYLGSGKPYLQRAIKKYNRKNFKREILEFFPTKEEAFNAQEKYIKEYNTLVPNGYNYSPTGGLRVKKCFFPGKKHSEETKKKMSLAKKGKPLSIEHILNLKGKNKGRKFGPISEEHRKSIAKIWKDKKISLEIVEKRANSNRGKKRSESAKRKMSLVKIGTKQSEETKLKKSLSLRGGKRSNETKEKIRLSKIGDKNPMSKNYQTFKK